MSPGAAPDLWSVITGWYDDPAVADACITLQDDHGADVVAMLAAAWGGYVLGDTSNDLYPTALRHGGPWRTTVIEPLRQVRRTIASTDPRSPSRQAVADAELAAEHHQVDGLESLFRDALDTRHDDLSDALVHQLAAAASHLRGSGDRVDALLAAIGAAIDPAHTPSTIETRLATARLPEAAAPSATVTCMQIASPSDEPIAARVDRVLDALDSRLDRHPSDLVVLPELWTTGFFHFDRYLDEAQPLDGPIARRLAAAAARHGVWLFAGSFVELADDGSRHNTSVAFGPNGRLAAHYRKIHLFGYESAEARTLTPGAGPVVLTTPFGRIGMATCYDLRFPELFRSLVDAGAEMFVVVSAWPAARREHWELLLRARAVENLSWVVACNAAGDQAGTDLAGTSLVISPWGEIVERAPTGPATLVASLELDRVSRQRAEFPGLTDRRPIGAATVFD